MKWKVEAEEALIELEDGDLFYIHPKSNMRGYITIYIKSGGKGYAAIIKENEDFKGWFWTDMFTKTLEFPDKARNSWKRYISSP